MKTEERNISSEDTRLVSTSKLSFYFCKLINIFLLTADMIWIYLLCRVKKHASILLYYICINFKPLGFVNKTDKMSAVESFLENVAWCWNRKCGASDTENVSSSQA